MLIKRVKYVRQQLLGTQTMPLDINHEIEILRKAIEEHGTPNSEGKHSCSYGKLFDVTANTLEALNGTLRAAKRQKKVAFEKELLMMPGDADVQVVWIG